MKPAIIKAGNVFMDENERFKTQSLVRIIEFSSQIEWGRD